MLRRVIKPILFLPLALSTNSINVFSSETNNYIDDILEEKSNISFVDYQEIENKLDTKIHVLYDSNDIINTLLGKTNKTSNIKNA